MNEPIPVAYQSGHAGPLIHVECWKDHDADTLARTGNHAFLGDLILEGHSQLKFARCGYCGARFLRSRKTTDQ